MEDGSDQDSGGGEEGEGEKESDTLGVTTVLDLSRVRLSSSVYTSHTIVCPYQTRYSSNMFSNSTPSYQHRTMTCQNKLYHSCKSRRANLGKAKSLLKF